jgi:hypothetical protein
MNQLINRHCLSLNEDSDYNKIIFLIRKILLGVNEDSKKLQIERFESKKENKGIFESILLKEDIPIIKHKNYNFQEFEVFNKDKLEKHITNNHEKQIIEIINNNELYPVNNNKYKEENRKKEKERDIINLDKLSIKLHKQIQVSEKNDDYKIFNIFSNKIDLEGGRKLVKQMNTDDKIKLKMKNKNLNFNL